MDQGVTKGTQKLESQKLSTQSWVVVPTGILPVLLETVAGESALFLAPYLLMMSWGWVWWSQYQNLLYSYLHGVEMNLLREVMESQCLELFKNRIDLALRDMVGGHGGDRLTVGLGDLRDLFQPQWCYDLSTIFARQNTNVKTFSAWNGSGKLQVSAGSKWHSPTPCV